MVVTVDWEGAYFNGAGLDALKWGAVLLLVGGNETTTSLLTALLYKGKLHSTEPFILELPPIRWPRTRNLLVKTGMTSPKVVGQMLPLKPKLGRRSR